MTTPPREHLHIPAIEGFVPEIGRAVWMLEDARTRTGHTLEGIAPEIVDWQPPVGNSIGTLLYHIALIEMDWLFNEVTEGKLPQSVWDVFPYPVRDETSHLTVVQGVSLDAHFKRLDSTRRLFLDVFQHMTLDDFRRARNVERYNVTPAWVIHHLLQHEAEHRGEIATTRALAEANI